ncbi:MAG: PAC2 family protein [Phycisphaerales bacterium]
MATPEQTERGTPKPAPWLIAAWPGMGNVAIIAAGYLVHALKMRRSGELPGGDHFDLAEVEVKGGLVAPARLPRGILFRWRNSAASGRDLVIFLGESQPASGTLGYANELLDFAARLGVERVITFASIASGLHPSENPKVMGVATDAATLDEMKRAEVEPLADGQIGGLNGVLLAAAARRKVAGMGLLAEIPVFAAAVPNPKAARAALSVFSVLSGIDVNLGELEKHAAVVDRALIDAMEKMQRQQAGEEPAEHEQEEEADAEAQAEAERMRIKPEQVEPKLDFKSRRRIEHLFEEARKDAGKAVPLKEELDRLGVFKLYEDRFLDLFRRAG